MEWEWLMQAALNTAGLFLACLCATYCLAAGLYTAAEWLEDHLRSTHRILKRACLLVGALQAAWLLFDHSLALPNAVGVASHAVSWHTLATLYPHHMGLDQPSTYATVILLIAHQTAWIYTWVHESGMVPVLAVLATVVWPVPTVLILSAGTEPDLPISAQHSAVLAAAAADSSSTPGSPIVGGSSSQPGSPFFDAARRQVRHTLHKRLHSGGAPLLPDSAPEADQQRRSSLSGLLAHGLRSKGSGEGAGSAGLVSSPWGAAADTLHYQHQQQPPRKRHRSRVVKAMDDLMQLLRQRA